MTMLRLITRRAAAMGLDVMLLFLVLWPAGLLALWLSGLRPHTGPQVYAMLLLNFSLPAWLYFMLCDASRSGQTPGKRLMSVRVVGAGPARALARTGGKLAAWELIHLGFFGLAPLPGQPGLEGWLAVTAAYALLLVSLVIALRTGGSASLHDVSAGTCVDRARPVAA